MEAHYTKSARRRASAKAFRTATSPAKDALCRMNGAQAGSRWRKSFLRRICGGMGRGFHRTKPRQKRAPAISWAQHRSSAVKPACPQYKLAASDMAPLSAIVEHYFGGGEGGVKRTDSYPSPLGFAAGEIDGIEPGAAVESPPADLGHAAWDGDAFKTGAA